MPSQVDLDQGGTFRAWARQFLGPSVGWVNAPADNVFPITAAGLFTIDPNITLVTVNINGVVTITLPKATDPTVPAGVLPGLFVNGPITIVDIGGFAGTNAITIKPAAGETIMNLSQITISVNYGGYTLMPNSTLRLWNSISP